MTPGERAGRGRGRPAGPGGAGEGAAERRLAVLHPLARARARRRGGGRRSVGAPRAAPARRHAALAAALPGVRVRGRRRGAEAGQLGAGWLGRGRRRGGARGVAFRWLAAAREGQLSAAERRGAQWAAAGAGGKVGLPRGAWLGWGPCVVGADLQCGLERRPPRSPLPCTQHLCCAYPAVPQGFHWSAARRGRRLCSWRPAAERRAESRPGRRAAWLRGLAIGRARARPGQPLRCDAITVASNGLSCGVVQGVCYVRAGRVARAPRGATCAWQPVRSA